MEENRSNMYKFGLVGKNISYSFSKNYFTKKFKKLQLENHHYCNFDIQNIKEFPKAIKGVNGLNITIPYKEEVLPYLDEIDVEAKEIGAVNTIKVLKNNRLKGFNTDVYGFKKALKPLLQKHHTKALVLGTGGASKAVIFVLKKLAIDYLVVSRNPVKGQISYRDISKNLIENYTVIINCTPLGTFPEVDKCPDIPYQYLTAKHLLFDLIYNPDKTKFLLQGEKKGAIISNGLKMLELQAEKSWKIWNQ